MDEIRSLLKWTRHDRLHAMFVVLALLGLRRSEVLGLRWEDVDLVSGTMRMRRGLHRIDGKLLLMETKTARSRQTIPLAGSVVASLQAHLSAQEAERLELAERWPDLGFVFTTPIGSADRPDNCSKQVTAAMKTGCAWCECPTSGTAACPSCSAWVSLRGR